MLCLNSVPSSRESDRTSIHRASANGRRRLSCGWPKGVDAQGGLRVMLTGALGATVSAAALSLQFCLLWVIWCDWQA